MTKKMENIRLYRAECMLLHNEELICDVMPNTDGLMNWTTSLEEATKTYESIKFEDFDIKQVYKVRINGYGNTYSKSIQVCDMPKWLFEDCHESELGEKYTPEEVSSWLDDCVFHEDCNLNIDAVKDELFEITFYGIENLRHYEK